MAQQVSSWSADSLEAAVVMAGGCAAALRSPDAWRNHHQGMAVAHDQLVSRVFTDIAHRGDDLGPADRPLGGLKVLDLTRVLAGPAATRFLAGFGAQVLRIDPPGREEPGVEIEMTVGKNCARLDLRRHREDVLALLAEADVLVHGYRPGAMDRLGLGEHELHTARPGLVEVMLDAYGWSGPWRGRRGFDSLVQMSSGIAFPADGDPDSRPDAAAGPGARSGHRLYRCGRRAARVVRTQTHRSGQRHPGVACADGHAARGLPFGPRRRTDRSAGPERRRRRANPLGPRTSAARPGEGRSRRNPRSTRRPRPLAPRRPPGSDASVHSRWLFHSRWTESRTDGQWMCCIQSFGTRPAGPGVGWSRDGSPAAPGPVRRTSARPSSCRTRISPGS